MQKRPAAIYVEQTAHFELTMSNLYYYCNDEKNYCKACGSKILLSLEKFNAKKVIKR
jgi:DNA-directed RNA polymerase subunit RPC12/RpoP